MSEKGYTWLPTHKAIVEYLRSKRNRQQHLIDLLESMGISGLHDEQIKGQRIPLTEIDPFSFFCYIYKHGSSKRLAYAQELAKKIGAPVPLDESGIPSAQPQQVCLFSFKYERDSGDITKLWDFFEAALTGTITDELFAKILQIKCTGKAKITEGLFSIMPETYLPINGPVKAYLSSALGLNYEFESWSDYLKLLDRIKGQSSISFYELSYEAWKWNKDQGGGANQDIEDEDALSYWIFQCNSKIYDLPTELSKGNLNEWTVKSHGSEIKMGDKIIMWVVGPRSGCYALAEVSGALSDKIDDKSGNPRAVGSHKAFRVPIRMTHNVGDRPILEETLSRKVLRNLNVGKQGTVFAATREQFVLIKEEAEQTLTPSWYFFAPGEGAIDWNEMYTNGLMGIAWNEIGDMNKLINYESFDRKLTIPGKVNKPRQAIDMCYTFGQVIKQGDVVIAKEGVSKCVGWGVVKSRYFYDATHKKYHHWREVEWKSRGSWPLTEFRIPPKTLAEIRDDDVIELLRVRLGIYQELNLFKSITKTSSPMHPLNTIFYGPPGTGKTYHTLKRAAEIVSGKAIDGYDEARRIYREYLHDRIEFVTFHQNYGYEDFVQGLRPDTENNGVLSFHKKDGIFKSIADKARRNEEASKKGSSAREDFETAFERFTRPLVVDDLNEIEVKMERSSFFVTGISERSIYFRNSRGNSPHSLSINTLRDFYYHTESSRLIQGLSVYYRSLVNAIRQKGDTLVSQPEPLRNYVLIIDEINRANISRVFGELITLIEDDKRTKGEHPMKVRLPSGDVFSVPSNLYIIGTMNTADKSIALLDIALRRRFVFEAMYPRTEIPGQVIHDAHILRSINEQIVKKKNHDFQIGHAYFMGSDYKRADRMNNKVIPLLLEYFMNDGDTVKDILKVAGLSVKADMWPLQVEE